MLMVGRGRGDCSAGTCIVVILLFVFPCYLFLIEQVVLCLCSHVERECITWVAWKDMPAILHVRERQSGSINLLHDGSAIPYQDPLVPPGTRTPALCAKQTPVDARDKLCVSAHSAHFPAPAVEHGVLEHIVLLDTADAHGAAVRPHTTRHVVAGAEQDI